MVAIVNLLLKKIMMMMMILAKSLEVITSIIFIRIADIVDIAALQTDLSRPNLVAWSTYGKCFLI